MPWKTEYLRDQRWRFLEELSSGKTTLARLCRRVGISRKTAYKWIARYEQEGRRGLDDRTRRAQVVHNRPTTRWLRRIRRLRTQHCSWGAKKLRTLLRRRYGAGGLPSVAAINRWLSAWGIVRRPRRRGTRRGPLLERPHLTMALRPNDVWSVDFKGWFRTGDGTRVDPLTVRDMATRFLLAFELLRSQSIDHTRAAFLPIFAEHGLPAAIRVDNGAPFGADGALGLTRLSAWWVRLGIRVEFITPGCPGENAGHEQMHGVYKAEEATPPAHTPRAQNQRTKRWTRVYNQIRPHEGLGMLCPATLYRASTRKMPPKLAPLSYPAGWLSRLVKGKGMISLFRHGRFIGEAFEGQRVGLKPTPTGWEVYFGDLLIGTLAASETTGIHAARYRNKSRPQSADETTPSQGRSGGLRPPAPPLSLED